MSKVLTVIPVLDPIYGMMCLSSILKDNSAAGINKEDILVIDNSKHGLGAATVWDKVKIYRENNHNIGVARAWNVGARRVVENDYDYLTIMSQSMLFGPEKETTWMKQLETFAGADVIESDGHSWHLIALKRHLFEMAGYFDENFYPGYFEQTDWCYRLRMLNREGGWPRVWVNAISQTVGHHSNLVLAPPLLDYYREKWGGDKGGEKYKLPWGDKPLGYFPKHSIPELAKKYELKEWW